MVATSHPLASAAGLAILAEGGNAVDAAIAASAVHGGRRPVDDRIGGDCFALYAPANGPVRALNGSGRAPPRRRSRRCRPRSDRHHSPDQRACGGPCPARFPRGAACMPIWAACRCRAVPRRDRAMAATGFPSPPRRPGLGRRAGHRRRRSACGGAFPAGPGCRRPLCPTLLADRLEEIAAHGPAAFYQGDTAARMVAHLRSLGGLHTQQDFADATDGAEWVDPISARYRGFDVHECPPNGQGWPRC